MSHELLSHGRIAFPLVAKESGSATRFSEECSATCKKVTNAGKEKEKCLKSRITVA